MFELEEAADLAFPDDSWHGFPRGRGTAPGDALKVRHLGSRISPRS